MPIQAALEWAFGTECAQIERDEVAQRKQVSATWLVAQIGAIGCQVDGGGYSHPAWDAEVIASTVSQLPVNYGGISMADKIAHHARTMTEPNWMKDATPRVYPVDTTTNRHGVFAKTEDAKLLHGSEAFQSVPRRNRKGAIVHDPVLCCPITMRPTGSQIASARRAYLDWWGALLYIGSELRSLGILSGITVTDEMPPMTPWKRA
ncbi:hypothetical protein [Celeribacter sp. SCSIO 80788]|uniref:hypothetical protein n=1 Tax=Celeribacter sp. SCSIO 80788 TaxID=3117013 RepID=UPI003DA1EE58